MVTTKLNLSMTEPQVRQIYAKQGDTGRVLDITLDQTPEDGTLRILRPDGVEVTSEAVTGGEVESGGTFESLAEADVTELTVGIEPVQDLNGYDAPWVGGAGKNLYNASAIGNLSGNGITATISNGTITLNGTATANAFFSIHNTGYANQQYTFSFNNPVANSGVHISFRDTNGNYFNDVPANVVNKTTTFTNEPSSILLYVTSGTTLSNFVVKPQLELGSTATAWQPYSNICPISGWTGCNVTRTGKNLFNKANGAKNLYVGGGNVTGTGGTLLCFLAKKETQYTINMTGGNRTNLYYYDTTSLDDIVSGITLNVVTLSAAKPYTFIADHDAVYCYYADTYFQQAVADSCMVELGSTATAYEPYQGSTYTTSLGQTVYGGTLDMVSGVLTVDRVCKTLTTARNLSGTYSGSIIYNSSSPETADADFTKPIQTNNLAYVGNSVTNFKFGTCINANGTSFNLWVQDGAFASLAEATAWLVANETQLCYYLPNPVTYQLTAQQIKTLVGTNNVWASSGQIVNIAFAYDGLLSELPSEATEIVGKCYCDVEQNGVSSMPFTLNVKKNERES